MRLFAGTATLTAWPPSLGVRLSDETLTSKEITLSAGASPKRTWVLAAPALGVGVGPAERVEPAPPQPTATSNPVTTKRANAARMADCANVFRFSVRISFPISFSGDFLLNFVLEVR